MKFQNTLTQNYVFGVNYETFNRFVAAYGLFGYSIRRYIITFFIRLARWGCMDSAFFGSKRINLGAYEAALLADVLFCHSAELFLLRPKGLLVREASRHYFGTFAYTDHILYL